MRHRIVPAAKVPAAVTIQMPAACQSNALGPPRAAPLSGAHPAKHNRGRPQVIEPANFKFLAMGTNCELQLYAESPEAASRAAKAAIAEAGRIEQAYSRYRQDSIVHAINMAAEAGDSIGVDGETADLIDIAFEAYSLSDRLFDITSGILREIWNNGTEVLPSQADIEGVLSRIGLRKVLWRRPELTFTRPRMQIDLGGIGKEYAADRAAQVCRSLGVQQGMVNLGGDIAIIGPHPDGAPWRIGIRDPKAHETAIATLFASSGGVATSGGYERYWEIEGRRFGHILNPLTGWPAEGLSSVTVGAQSCGAAGLYSTIAILKGEAGPQWLREKRVAHLFVDACGRLDLSGIQKPEDTPPPAD